MPKTHTFSKNEVTSWALPNYWDFVALILVVSVIVVVGWGAKEMVGTYTIGEKLPISLAPSALPYYALRTVLRMFIALFFSLIFTLIFGTWAAKSRQAERVIVPLIDILQSVPVLSFQAIAVVPFIVLFHGSMLGPEMAAIFAIFTSQVWNMTLSFYQSCSTVPEDLREAARMFQLSWWQRFWRIDVPYAMPGLVWNAMMSMSASWFFVVACEAITVANQDILLPGIGSYIATALPRADLAAVGYAIIAMLIVILAYDQLIFRPLSQWIDRFKFEEADEDESYHAWVVDIFQRTQWFRVTSVWLSTMWDHFVNWSWWRRKSVKTYRPKAIFGSRSVQYLMGLFIVFIVSLCSYFLVEFVFEHVSWHEGLRVIKLGAYTATRVMILIFLSTLVWLPVGVWIGLRPRVTRIVQPLIQLLASFPAYLFYPIVVMLIVRYQLNPEIWTSPLIILGTQWYILFNVIVGTMSLPKSLKQVTSNLHVKGWLWWRRLILPGIFPYYVTGAITAAGGAWNASIVAEAVSWGGTKIEATGLGAYITHYATIGDYPRLALGTAIMCLYVVVINRVFWRPLYNMSQQQFVME